MLNSWIPVDALPQLEPNEVQLWRIDLSGAVTLSDRYLSLLSPEEQAQAQRCRPGHPREHFTVGRACLRLLLGNTLGVVSGSVEISAGVHGKPEISGDERQGLSFNVAHSKNTILIALGRQGALGVDIEYFDRRIDIMEVSRSNFTENETRFLASIEDPGARVRTFYQYWTRKEAIAKADGRGLLLPLSSFDVSHESTNLQPVRVHESPDDGGRLYFVTDLEVVPDAAAALATDSADYRLVKLLFPLGAV